MLPIQKKVEEELDISLDELEKIKSVALKLDADIAEKKAKAKKEAKEMKKQAIEEAKLEKRAILSDLREFRDKTKKILSKKKKKKENHGKK